MDSLRGALVLLGGSGCPGQGLQTGIGMGKIGMGMEEGKSTKLQTIAANEERYRQMHEKAGREAERRIQENAKRRELQFSEMFANVQNGIDRKSGILKEVDQLVEQSDRSKDKRARALYQSWNEQVYSNIQKQSQQELNALPTEEIEARLNRKYGAFLQASNQKAGFFMKGNESSTAVGPATGGGLIVAGGTGGAGVGGGSLPHQAGASDKLGTMMVSTAKVDNRLKRSMLKIKEGEKGIITKGWSPLEKTRAQRRCNLHSTIQVVLPGVRPSLEHVHKRPVRRLGGLIQVFPSVLRPGVKVSPSLLQHSERSLPRNFSPKVPLPVRADSRRGVENPLCVRENPVHRSGIGYRPHDFWAVRVENQSSLPSQFSPKVLFVYY